MGDDKSSQQKDIAKAIELARNFLKWRHAQDRKENTQDQDGAV